MRERATNIKMKTHYDEIVKCLLIHSRQAKPFFEINIYTFVIREKSNPKSLTQPHTYSRALKTTAIYSKINFNIRHAFFAFFFLLTFQSYVFFYSSMKNNNNNNNCNR